MSSRSLSLVSVILFLIVLLGCDSPLSRFTKQYKCQIAGQPEPQNAYAYIQRGHEHVNLNELDCAVGACAEAIRLEPKRAAGYACRGGILGQQRHYRLALRDLNQALSLEPQNGDYYYTRGQINE